ncbi:hypothetical protein ACLOJK_004369 [Asimina triloba]
MTKDPGGDVRVVDKTLTLSETEKRFNRHVVVDIPFKESRSHAPFPLGEEGAVEDVIWPSTDSAHLPLDAPRLGDVLGELSQCMIIA